MKRDATLSRCLMTLLLATCASSGAADTWHQAAPLFASRYHHAATMLLDGRILVAGGIGEGGETLASAEIFDPESGRWESTGSLSKERSRFTATLLPSGKVLVVGGRANDDLNTAELYDPVQGTWSDAGSVGEPRRRHTATLLASGEVLVVGGYGDGQYRSTVMLYSPADGGSWQPLASLAEPRREHTATLLASGKVLVGGGRGSLGAKSSFELFDPAHPENGWERFEHQPARARHSATLLPSGNVLVGGGEGEETSVEVYDPGTGGWSSLTSTSLSYAGHTATLLPSGNVLLAGKMGTELYDPAGSSVEVPLELPRTNHTATLLPSGDLLVVGGEDPSDFEAMSDVRILTAESPSDPLASSGTLATSRHRHAATLLSTGAVLVAGGEDDSGNKLGSIEVYAPSGSWSQSGATPEARSGLTVTLLATGQVLLTGGMEDGEVPSSAVELVDPAGESLTSGSNLLEARGRHTATLLPSGEVLVVGGEGSDGDPLSSVELYNPEENKWSAASPLHAARLDHRATLLPTGQVLVTGGLDKSGFMRSSVELYDPATDTWATSTDTPPELCFPGAAAHPSAPCPLSEGRSLHTATLLASGRVLVAGGGSEWAGEDLASAEIYDPVTGRWSVLEPLHRARSEHSAVLLPSGKVLVTGGTDDPAQVEVYDPATVAWTLSADSTAPGRRRHTSTLLPSGDVLVVGGAPALADVRLFHPLANVADRRPIIDSVGSTIVEYGVPFTVEGRRFGSSEGGTGNTRQSAANHSLVQLRAVAEGIQAWLTLGPVPVPLPAAQLVVEEMPPIFNPGWHLLTVLTEGMASESVLVHLACSLGEVTITQVSPPQGAKVTVGSTATFEVRAAGGRTFRWQQCDGDPATTCADQGGGWLDLPGATGSTWTTPVVTGPESGRRFRARIGSGCTSAISPTAVLQVADDVPPVAAVVTPAGGEFWILSDVDTVRHETVTWSMSDNVRICQVRVSLWGSADGGTFTELPATGTGLPASFPGADPELPCYFPGEGTTSTLFTLPTDFTDLGGSGWQYKVRVEVRDHAGNTTTVESENPFFIVRPNDEAVKSLILWNSGRTTDAFGDVADLERNLRVLAAHPEVEGTLVDLAGVDPVACLYAWWDAPGQPVGGCPEEHRPCQGLAAGALDTCLANSVLFDPDEPGVDDPFGVHAYLLDQLLPAFPGVETLVLAGDDGMVPLARLEDRCRVLSEDAYPAGGDLSPTATTVGRALANNQYLSDDPLATRDRVQLDDAGSVAVPAVGDTCPESTAGLALIPDLAVGRLVETPAEIIGTITTFVSESGTLDLTDPRYDDRKVLVTGYDFLFDSAAWIAATWRGFLEVGEPTVGSTLVDPQENWGADELQAGLCGDGAVPYPVVNLNGHANHYEEGIPGPAVYSDDGLTAEEIDHPQACGTAALDLSGAVIYAVGCHGGLPVPDLGDNPGDHPLDLPQTFLRRGAVAYLANTGFGWGLLAGPPGYAERLVVLFTEELTAAGSISVGEAVKRAKTRYFLDDSGCFDAYDQKSLMQWTLFGLPMFTVQTGAPAPARATPRTLKEAPAVEHFGGVTVSRRPTGGSAPLPPFLTRLDLHFDFSAAGVYRKYQSEFDADTHQASNLEIALADPCDPSSSGCFYTLNGLATGQADLPVQPYFVYGSRLSGTSQHGVLWKGATYQEEEGWKELRAVLQSNNDGGFEDNLGALPKAKRVRPRPTRQVPGEDPDGGGACPPSDLELNSLTLPTGEVVETADRGVLERRDLSVDLEIFYFNNTADPGENCDRDGPDFGAEPYHRVRGTAVEWAVAASDPSGVWRVVAVINDGTVDATGRGSWVAVELAGPDQDGVWNGVYEAAGAALITYFLQAVDRRGNVAWLLFEAPEGEKAASGIPADLPLPLKATVTPGTTDLALTMVDAFDPVAPLSQLSYGIRVENRGTMPASQVRVTDILPPATQWLVGGGEGWVCAAAAGSITCDGPDLESDQAAELYLVLGAPDVDGLVVNQVRVDAAQDDPVPANDAAFEATLVSAGTTPPAPPTAVVFAAPTGDLLGGCAQTRGPVTGLWLSFSEAMRAPAAETPDSVTRTASYLLLAPGPDQDFATASCTGGPAGDDTVVTIDGVVCDEATRVATVAVNGGRGLADGLYRFLACASILDLGAQPLDGDGDGVGGDDLVLGFRVDRFNLFANGHFDDCPPVTLAPWQIDAGPLSEVVTSAADAGGSPLSGSAEMRFSAHPVTMGQCVPVSANGWLTLRARLRRTATDPGLETPPFRQRCRIYAEPACTGSVLDSYETSQAVATGTAWQLRGFDVRTPAEAASAYCDFGFPDSDRSNLDVELDDLFVSDRLLLFADGFETGDLAAWSSQVP